MDGTLIIVHNHKIISADSNHIHTKENIISHAEVNAIHNCAPFFKEVHKENGSKPGFVIYFKQKSIFVTPDEDVVMKLRK